MPKLNEAKEILKALGLPAQQQRSVAAYTLVALANVGERNSWSSAHKQSLRVHDILLFLEKVYKKSYAENSRETIRRQVLHQLEQANVVERNPDDPSLPTNHPRTHYALSDQALKVVRSYGSKRFSEEANAFVQNQGSLLALYTAGRARHLIPVKLPSGKEVMFSPGKHNELQATLINTFGPRFAPGALLLYVGDTAQKALHLEVEILAKLGVPITKHDKLPDVVLYLKERNWLFLVEAVTSHGPVSAKRKFELEEALSDCTADRIYVSAFRDFKEFKRHVDDIAWETEVWVAENPEHLIHYNGDKFLGPATST